MSSDATATSAPAAAPALELISTLADEIGPRRPTSRAEGLAAEVVREALSAAGADAEIEPFDGYDSFVWPYGAIGALAVAPALLPRDAIGVRAGLAALALGLLAAEGGLRWTPVSDLLARRPSRNVVATVEPAGSVERTLCLVAHLDTSRSGLLFDPRLGPAVRRLFVAQSAATAVLAGEPLLRRARLGRVALSAARAICATGLALLAERELRGVDVPGANDNASGAGAVVQLASEHARAPLATTRLVILVCGCEESGLLGARAFLDAHDTSGWLFLNFDGVAAPATLRYLPKEGIGRTWHGDPGLIAIAERVRAERPDLGLEPADAPIGLTYDSTPVLARGGRALTLVAGDGGRIPNYHQPSDTVANLDPERLAKAIEVGRELIALVDRGEAD
jgi:hypothetical protein